MLIHEFERMVRLIIFATLIVASQASAQDGRPDPAFGDGGVVRLIPTLPTGANDVVLLEGGETLVAGVLNDEAVVFKLDATGHFVSDFGAGGVARLGFPSASEATALVTHPDGRIDVTVHRPDLFTAERATLVRLLPSGNRDVSFGTDGVAAMYRTRPIAAVMDGAGRTLVLGYDGALSTASFLFRVDADGALDASYGEDGVVTLFEVAETRMSALALDGLGRAVLAGHIGPGFPNFQGAVARVTPAGALDETFGDEGIARPIPEGEHSGLRAVHVETSGQIWVGGRGDARGLGRVIVAKLNADGTRVPGFGADGLVMFDDGYRQSEVQEIQIQPDGNVLLAGFSDTPTGYFSLMAARLLPGGDRDPTFGEGGIALVPTEYEYLEFATAMELDADGTITLAGNRYVSQDITLVRIQGVVARFLNDFLVPSTAPPDDARLMLTLSGQNPSRDGRVTLRLTEASTVRTTVHDMLGRSVAVLHDGPLAVGDYTFDLSRDLAPGIYLIRATADGAAAVLTTTIAR